MRQAQLTIVQPDGSIARTVEMPVAIPTSVMFGSPKLDVLYVTMAGAPQESDDM